MESKISGLKNLTDKQKEDLITGGISDTIEGKPTDPEHTAILVLGAGTDPLFKRMAKAINLYKDGHAKYMIMSGGKGWTKNGSPETIDRRIKMAKEYLNVIGTDYSEETLREMTEAEIMYEIANAMDIPDDALIWEHYSENTQENMENVSMLINHEPKNHKNKQYKKFDIKNIIIVTNPTHARRSLYTAQKASDKFKYKVVASSLLDKNVDGYWKIIDDEVERLIKYAKGGNLRDATVVFDGESIKPVDEVDEVEKKKEIE